MSKILIAFAFMASLVLFSAGCNTQESEVKKNASIANEKEEHEDGMELYMKQRIKMTMDPALGYVPYERLAIAQKEAERRSSYLQRTNGNFTWEERGPKNIGGRTRALLIDKNDPSGNTIFAGSVGGGIWKCTAFKSSSYNWTKVNDQMENLAVSCIAQNPSNPSEMYAGTGEGFYNADALRGGGIFKSIDGGNSWVPLPSTIPDPTSGNYSFYYIQDILVMPNGNVYATARGFYCNSGGVFKSTDGGTSWTKVVGVLTASSCSVAFNCRGNDLELAANGDLYVTTGLQSTTTANSGRVFKSPASLGALQGESGQWTDITPTPPSGESGFRRIEIACSPSAPNEVFLACQRWGGSDVTKFYKSNNGGTNWAVYSTPSWCDQGTTKTDFTRGQAWYDLIAVFDPANSSNIYVGGVDIMKSTNGGSSFSQLTRWSSYGCGSLPVVHADIHNIEFINGSSTEMIVCNDGGIYYSTDAGNTFSTRNTDYNVTQYYSVAIHPNAGSDYMLAGAQDNGTHKFSTPGVNAVTYASGGDGAFCFIDQQNPIYQISSYVYSNYYISRNSGASFNLPVNSNNGDFINPGDYDSQSKILYCQGASGTFGRVRNITSGTPYIEAITISQMGGSSACAFKVDPNTVNRVYMGVAYTTSANILRMDNANSSSPTVTNISIPGVNGYISSIDVENGNASHLLVTLANYGVTSVYESTDGGLAWTSIEGDLPDVPVNAGIFLPIADKRIILATDAGVWSTGSPIGSTSAWMPDNIGMANVASQQFALRLSDSTLAVATHGRGVFTTKLGTALPLKLLNFNGVLENQMGILSWKTASEINTSHFEVEKSINGLQFSKIGNVKAAGISSATKNYTFKDNKATAINNYYRLRMVDIDGKFTYSNIVLLKNNSANQQVDILSNPISSYIDVRFAKLPFGEVVMQLSSASGAVLTTQKFSNLTQYITRWHIGDKVKAKGVYTLTVFNNKEKYSIKVLKN